MVTLLHRDFGEIGVVVPYYDALTTNSKFII